jgi:ribose 5-phosphate isomerase A
VERIEPGMTVGLGSGRAVFEVVDVIARRWAENPPLRAAVASGRTRARALAAGLPLIEPDGEVTLDLVIDGADEVTRDLDLIKGGGGALLREKLLVSASRRFVVVAETHKLVDRLGDTFLLPVQVVRFAWGDTRRRLLELTPEATLRLTPEGQPVSSEDGHYTLDCQVPAGDLAAFARACKALVGVVEHGLFLGMAHEALLGDDQGEVHRLPAPTAP